MFIVGIVYLAIPVFLILFSFFSAPFVLLSAVALVLLVFGMYKSHYEGGNIDLHLQTLSRYWPLLLICFTIAYLSLVYPFYRQDWGKHFAVLNALAQGSWPPIIEFKEQTWFLRYYVAWYAFPALAAKIIGLQSLTVATAVIWTATGLFIALLLAFHNIRKTWPLFVGALIFFFFSGLDIIKILFTHHIEPVTPHWLHWWPGIGHVGSNLSNITWVPQHITGACVATSLYIYNSRLALQYSGVIVVMMALWSPFCAIGLAPAVVWAVLKEGYKPAFSRQNWLITPLLAIPVVLYLIQGAEQVPFMFAWQHPDFSLTNFIWFCTVEFLLIMGVLYWFEREERTLLVILAMFLPLISLLHWGIFNELLLKGSIPTVCIIAILVANSLLKNLKSGEWHRNILIAYLIAGTIPVVVAFVKGLTMERADKKMTFEKLTTLYSEEHPSIAYRFIAHQYLVKTKDVAKVFDAPLLRGLPEKRKSQKDIK